MNNDFERVLLSAKEIEKITEKLAQQITEDYKGKDLLVIGLLKGSFVFISDLVRHIDLPCKLDFMSVSSYGSSTSSSGNVKILMDCSLPIDNANVLIVEDIIDSGNTLSYIVDYIYRKGASDVKICTLLNKPKRRETHVDIQYEGTTIDDNFVAGYGMDYNETYRNIPYIGILKKEIYS